MNNINFRKNNTLLFLLGVFSCLWLTTWEIGPISISKIFFFYIFVFFVFIDYQNTIPRDLKIINYILISIMILNFFYFIIGFQFYENNNLNLDYLIEYFLKETVYVFLTLILSNYIFYNNRQNIDYLIFGTSITLIILILILTIYYKFVLGSPYIGVKIDFIKGNIRTGKNTFAQGLMLLIPFVFIFFFNSKKIKKITFIFFASLISYFIIQIDSSATIIAFVTLIALLVPTILIGYSKKILQYLTILTSIFLLLFHSNIIAKLENEFIVYEKKKSKRIKLIKESWNLSKQSYFLGNGTGTFRVRHPDIKSKTETHNVYLNYLSEKGLFGLGLNIFLYIYLLFLLLKKKYKPNSYECGAILSIVSILIVFNFINIEVSPLLWVINAVIISAATLKNEEYKKYDR